METILREIEFNQWVLRLNIRNLGGFWIDGYIHTAPTRIFLPLEGKELEKVIEECEKNPHTKNLVRREIKKGGRVEQIEVPIRQMGARHYSLTQLKDYFSRGEFSEQTEDNERLRRFGAGMMEALIKEKEEGLRRGLRKEKRTVLEIEELREPIKNLAGIRKARGEKRRRMERIVDYLLGFLEKGHPLDCRVRKDKSLKVEIPSPLPEEFIKGHYVEGAESKIAPEGSVVEISEGLERILNYRILVNDAVRGYNFKVEDYLVSRGLKAVPGNFTRVNKALDEVFSGEGREERLAKEVKTIGGVLTEEVVEGRRNLEGMMKELAKRGKRLGGCRVEPDYAQGKVELRFSGDISEQIKFRRMRTAEEVRKAKWMLIDWENFEFGTENEGITLGAMGYLRRGRFYGARVKSIYRVGIPKLRGFKVVDNFASSQELVESVRDDFVVEQAAVACAYNTVYDLIEARRYGDFGIGSLGREPRKVSTVPFFERIGIPARDVIDPLRWARAQYDFLPNCKLVMVVKKIDEEERGGEEGGEKDELEKIINYRHGRELERGRRTDKWEHLSADTVSIMERFHGRSFRELEDKVSAAGQLLSYYAATDLEKLVKIIKSRRFNWGMEDVGFMSELFGVDFFLLFHEPKRVDRFLNRAYFEERGTWRTEVFPRFANITKWEQRAKAYFQREKGKKMGWGNRGGNGSGSGREKGDKEGKRGGRGLFEDVYKLYIPWGRLFREEIKLFMRKDQERIEKFFDYIDKHKEEPLRSYFLSKYEKAMFNWLYMDYALYCHTEHQYEKLKKNLGVEGREGLEERLGEIYEELKVNAWETEDIWLLRNLMRAKVSQEELGMSRERVEGLNGREEQALFNWWVKKRNQERRIQITYGKGVRELEEKFERVYASLESYLEEKGFKVVLVQNDFVYVQGNRERLEEEGCPFILVDELEKVYVTEHPSGRRKNAEESERRIYYPRGGYWEGIKEEEEATYLLNVFEINCYTGFLERLFSGDKVGAVRELYFELDALGSRKVPAKELVWYSKSGARFSALEEEGKVFFEDGGGEVKYDAERDEYFLMRAGKGGKEERIKVKKEGGGRERTEGGEKKRWGEKKGREKGRYYFIEKKERRREERLLSGYKEEVRKKIYLMRVEEVKVGWEQYFERIGERAEMLLEPIVGWRGAIEIVREGLNPEGMRFDQVRKKYLGGLEQQLL